MSSEKLPHWTPYSNEPTSPKGRSNFKSMASSVAKRIDPRRRSTVNADEESLFKEITVDQDTLANASCHPPNECQEAVHNSPSAFTDQDLQPRTEPCSTPARAQTHHSPNSPQEQLQFMFPVASENTISPDKIQRYRNDVKAIESRLNHVGSDVRPEYNRMIAETVVGSVKILGDEIWDAVRQMIGVRSGQDQIEKDRNGPSAPAAQKVKVTQPPMKTHADVPAKPQEADEFEYPTIFRAQLSDKQDGMYRHRVRRLNDQLTHAVSLGERQFTHFLAEALIGLRQCLRIYVDLAEGIRASEKADIESKMEKSCQKGQDGLYKDLSRRIEDSRCHCRGKSAEQVAILSETTAGVPSE